VGTDSHTDSKELEQPSTFDLVQGRFSTVLELTKQQTLHGGFAIN